MRSRFHPAALCLLLSLPLLAMTPDMPRFRWENFTVANGLPDNHVYCVLVDGNRIWAGTESGLAVYENHAWKTYTTADGLAHRAGFGARRRGAQ